MAFTPSAIKEIFQKIPGNFHPEYGKLINHVDGLRLKYRDPSSIYADEKCLVLFITASVDMWHRAINCFLESAAASDRNNQWASVSGYYSSHYVIRAFNHLFGFLNSRVGVYEVRASKGGFCLHKLYKNRQREHKYCWNIAFKIFDNDLFYECTDEDKNDQGHRNFATYFDHLNPSSQATNLDDNELKGRINSFSAIPPSIPDKSYYPDTNSVISMAFNRIAFYQKWLDENIGPTTNYWSLHRDPSWCRNVMRYESTWPKLQELIDAS